MGARARGRAVGVRPDQGPGPSRLGTSVAIQPCAGGVNARESDGAARSRCAARRESTDNSSRRIRSRGDPPRARRQARRAIDETGHRDRVVQGAAGGRQAAVAATERKGVHETERRVGTPRRRTTPRASVTATLARHARRTETRAAQHRKPPSSLASGANRGAAAVFIGSKGGGTPRRPYARAAPARCRRIGALRCHAGCVPSIGTSG